MKQILRINVLFFKWQWQHGKVVTQLDSGHVVVVCQDPEVLKTT